MFQSRFHFPGTRFRSGLWGAALAALLTAGCNRGGENGTAPEDNAVPSGTAYAAATQGGISGLDFPSDGGQSDVRFRFTGANLIPMYPATYVWRVNLRQQAGYYASFYWGPDGAFTGASYFGAHPYPDGNNKVSSTSHKWGLAIDGNDYVADANGHTTQLGYGVWKTQALRVYDNGSWKVHEFYWDLPDTTKVIRTLKYRSYGAQTPANAALSFGAAPWNPSGQRLSGILRGIQLYAAALSTPDILNEINAPLGTAAGGAKIWYLNLNPTPADISDKSGRGHHPVWVGTGRPAAWSDGAPTGGDPGGGTPPPAPTVSLSANPATVNSGEKSTLTWSSTDATGCTASGAWNGAKAVSGSEQSGALSSNGVFTLVCDGAGGSASQSATVAVTPSQPPPSGGTTALDFPSNGGATNDVRFRFTGANLIPMYPATYVWRVNLRQQSGYYTAFFWGPDGAFTGAGYYGAHPYPDGSDKPGSMSHKWELSIDGNDYVGDANGHSTQLGYNAWKTQALRVFDDGTRKVHEYYWDLPDTTKVIRVFVARSYGPPANPALTFGTAPWAPGTEHLSGLLRGIQLYSAALSPADIVKESGAPLSTASGNANVWYLNLNPAPGDIADKSGKGHHPAWVTSLRPGLWTAP